ncbi:hypothetical protein Bca4012_008198 [Brassica carinata]
MNDGYFQKCQQQSFDSSISAAMEGQSSSLCISFTSCSQSSSNCTLLFLVFKTSCIAHIRPSASA